jgi:uncharacterized repeat protein (TIGR01451 family)
MGKRWSVMLVGLLTLLFTHGVIAGGNVGVRINAGPVFDLAQSVPIQGWYNSPRRIMLRTAEPVLCVDMSGSTSGVAIDVVTPNGDSQGLLRGLSRIEMYTNGTSRSVLQVSGTDNLACCLMLPNPNATCIQGSRVGVAMGPPPPPNQIFRSGFENTAAAPDSVASTPNLSVVITSAQSTRAPSQTWAYQIVVGNTGSATASGVRVRDWFPKSGNFSPALNNGSWTCQSTGGATCGGSSGSGLIELNNATIPAGGRITFNVSRVVVNSPPPPNGSTIWVSAVAFMPGSAEQQIGDNQGALSVRVQQ